MNGKDNKLSRKKWLDLPFTQFPKIFDRMTEVNGSDKAVLRVIFNKIWAAGKGDVYPTKKTIAREAGIGESTVWRAVNKWIRLGILESEFRGTQRYYYILNIPDEIMQKYGDKSDMKQSERQKQAAEVIANASKKISDSHQARIERKEKLLAKHRHDISVSTFTKVERKKPFSSEVYNVAKHYMDVFDAKINHGRTGESKIPLSFTKKEYGQIKYFIDTYNAQTLKNVINECFGKWEQYKRRWHLTEVDWPSIGILVTYSKNDISRFRSASASVVTVSVNDGDDDEYTPKEKIKFDWS